MILHYTDKAKEDVDLAFKWYEEQRQGLGFDFLDSIELSVRNIIIYPKMYLISHSVFRRALIKKFPFSLFYTLEEGISRVVVHAVFDNRQNPEKVPRI